MKPINFNFELDIQKARENEKSGKWIVEGLASTTDLDMQDDIVHQKAINAAASDLKTNSTVLYNHDVNRPIGKVLDSKAINGGIWIKVMISKLEKELWGKIKEGILNKFSIRGKILDAKKKWVKELKKWVKVILGMQLAEVSMVSVPANPEAKALRWYIGKSLHDFYDDGNDLEIFKGDEKEMSDIFDNFTEELLKSEPEETDNSETIEKQENNEEIEKASGILGMLEEAINNLKDEKEKKRLMSILANMRGKRDEEGEKGCDSEYPKSKKKEKKKSLDAEEKADSDDIDFNELNENTDPDVEKAIAEALELLKEKSEEGVAEEKAVEDKEEVEKAGKSISRKSEKRLADIAAKLNEAISMVQALVGKTEDAEKTKKILEKFEEAKNMIDEKTEKSAKDQHLTFEKIAEFQEKLAEKSIKTEEKVNKAIELLETVLKGVPAMRDDEGNLVTGDKVIKGIDERKTEKDQHISPVEAVMQDEKYQKAPVNQQRDMLLDVLSNTINEKEKL